MRKDPGTRANARSPVTSVEPLVAAWAAIIMSSGASGTPAASGRDDVGALARLCVEHARFERAGNLDPGLEESLCRVLSGADEMATAWIVAEAGIPVGYATASPAFSTWQAREYLHMDCLFLVAGARRKGYGALLMNTVLDYALEKSYRRVEWQTPSWNSNAIAFYARFGARSLPKERFVLVL